MCQILGVPSGLQHLLKYTVRENIPACEKDFHLSPADPHGIPVGREKANFSVTSARKL